MKNKLAWTALFLLIALLTGCKEKENNAPMPMGPMEVDVSKPVTKVITEWDEYTGRFAAINNVEIRGRVTGYLTKQTFKDGELVKKGDMLFEIDPRPFEFALARAQAQFNLTEKEYARSQKLRDQHAVSQEDLDKAFQELQEAKAILNQAQLDVEFTQIRSPINGRISDAFVDIGNLVEANKTLLTRVVSTDPIHFEVEASQNDLLKYLRLDIAGQRVSSVDQANPIFIKLQDEKNFAHVGRIDFVDNIIDPNTGTIKFRAIIPNEDSIIYPGLFGRARVPSRTQVKSVLVPEKVIQTDQNRKFIYVVNDKNQVSRAYVTLGQMLDNGFLPILTGLKGDETIIVSGVQRVRMPNQEVKPNQVDINWTPINTMPDIDSVPSLKDLRSRLPNKVIAARFVTGDSK